MWLTSMPQSGIEAVLQQNNHKHLPVRFSLKQIEE
jgi:hypothetical protein